jgi:hypothetical protein
MIGQPKRRQNDNGDTDGCADESESTVIALAQAGRLRRRVILHFFRTSLGNRAKRLIGIANRDYHHLSLR